MTDEDARDDAEEDRLLQLHEAGRCDSVCEFCEAERAALHDEQEEYENYI